MFRPYASIQNKILIDYKTWRDDILNGVKALKAQDEKRNKIVSILTEKLARAKMRATGSKSHMEKFKILDQ